MKHEGNLAWAGLALGVAAWDVWAMRTGHETMTAACHRHMENPMKRAVILGAIGLTALHLAKAIPRELDVYYGFKPLQESPVQQKPSYLGLESLQSHFGLRESSR